MAVCLVQRLLEELKESNPLNVTSSPADTQVDLEVGFKLFFFTDFCSPDLAGQESD